jgi:hypothetical protein
MTKKKTLIPPDRFRCQAETRGPHSFMTFGPAPRFERCKNKPYFIAFETKPDKDGLIGSMSLCKDCQIEALKRLPKDFMRFEEINGRKK